MQAMVEKTYGDGDNGRTGGGGGGGGGGGAGTRRLRLIRDEWSQMDLTTERKMSQKKSVFTIRKFLGTVESFQIYNKK